MTSDPDVIFADVVAELTKMDRHHFRNALAPRWRKACPTFSSGDIVRNVLSTHFLSGFVDVNGPGCIEAVFVLSLEKHSVTANSSIMSRRCRNMPFDQYQTGRDVCQWSERASRPSSRAGNTRLSTSKTRSSLKFLPSIVAMPSAWTAGSSPNPPRQCTSGSRRTR